MHILWSLIVGLVVGALAKLFMPGKDPGGVVITMLLGIAGSLVAFTAYAWLLQVSTPAKVSTYAYVNPLIAVLLGRFVPSLADGPHGACVPGLSLRPRDGLSMQLTRRC